MNKKYKNKLLLILSILCIDICLISYCINNNHTVNTELIKRFNEKYSYSYYDQLANNDRHLEYKNGEQKLAIESLSEITNYLYIYIDCSQHKNCMEVIWKNNLTSIDDINYKNTIEDALNNMNLICTDKKMIEQINKWICDNIEYEKTDGDLYRLFDKYQYKGQCWHYARLFQDMCRAVGIDMQYCVGYSNEERHAWNFYILNGTTYYFDITWNDSSKTYNKYMFKIEKEFRKSHEW